MDQEVVDLTQDESVVVAISGAPKLIEVVEVSDTEEPDRSAMFAARPRLSLTREQRQRRQPTLECPICIEPFQNVYKRAAKCVVTICGHLFCDKCLEMALSQQGRHCPKCRKPLPKKAAFIQVFDIC